MKRKKLIKVITTIIIITLCGTFLACGSTAEKIQEQLQLGNKYLQEGKYEEAILAFNKAIEIEPKNIEARIGLADVYIATDKHEDAEKVLREAIEIDKTRTESYLKLVELFEKINRDINDVIDLIKEALQNTQDSRFKDMLNVLIPQQPEVSVQGGKYNEVQVIDFINLKDGQEVYYTIDDTKPTKESLKYTEPISIGNGTSILRAIIVDSKGVISEEIRNEYVVDIPKVAIDFEDKAFEEMIRKMLGKEKGKIYNTELAVIEEINIMGVINVNNGEIKRWSYDGEHVQICFNDGREYTSQTGNIENLNDLKWFTNLKRLRIRDNQIDNISGLKDLENLTEISLEDNKISNISTIKDSRNLEELFMSYNQISDISVLNKLTKLKGIAFFSNKINDISAIERCVNLERIYLNENEISDINSLKYMVNLIDLDLENNKIRDISSLKELTNLTSLSLRGNEINDISILKRLTNLTFLGLFGNKINDISALRGLTKLTYLDLFDNPIEDYSPLDNLTNTNIVK